MLLYFFTGAGTTAASRKGSMAPQKLCGSGFSLDSPIKTMYKLRFKSKSIADTMKGTGTSLRELHVCYSLNQKCNKLDTFTVQGTKINKQGLKF
jgi:hypothetical protein